MKNRRRKLEWCLLLGLAFSGPLSAPVRAASFGAGIENSQWYLSESVFECTLVHEVPGYGRALFRHRAGESLSFRLEAGAPLMKPGRGSLLVEAPVWRPGVAPRAVGAVEVSSGPQQVTLGARQSWILARGLLEGMQPTIVRASWYDDRPVRVQVSSINFAAAFQRYLECTESLLPVNFDQIQRSRIPFASGSARLSAADRQKLDNIATYVLADPTIEIIFVDGHADRTGSRIDNWALSEKRANVVADYLESRGVDPSKLVVRAHGDRYPASRRPADNRRTTIRLQRLGERPLQAQGYGNRPEPG